MGFSAHKQAEPSRKGGNENTEGLDVNRGTLNSHKNPLTDTVDHFSLLQDVLRQLRIDWTAEMVEKLKVAVAQGMGNPAIAKQLGVSVAQVNNKRQYMAQLAKVRAGRNEMEGLESGPTYSILKSFKQKGWMIAPRSQ